MAKAKVSGKSGVRQVASPGESKGVISKAAEAGKTVQIRARIDPALKLHAEAILEEIGLNASEAIRLFYRQITLSDGLPFPVKIPNARTVQAMRDADAGRVTRNGSVAELFEELGI